MEWRVAETFAEFGKTVETWQRNVTQLRGQLDVITVLPPSIEGSVRLDRGVVALISIELHVMLGGLLHEHAPEEDMLCVSMVVVQASNSRRADV